MDDGYLSKYLEKLYKISWFFFFMAGICFFISVESSDYYII